MTKKQKVKGKEPFPLVVFISPEGILLPCLHLSDQNCVRWPHLPAREPENSLSLFFFFFWPALGLCCFAMGFLSSSNKRGTTLSCSGWASHCRGFSCFRAWALGVGLQ